MTTLPWNDLISRASWFELYSFGPHRNHLKVPCLSPGRSPWYQEIGLFLVSSIAAIAFWHRVSDQYIICQVENLSPPSARQQQNFTRRHPQSTPIPSTKSNNSISTTFPRHSSASSISFLSSASSLDNRSDLLRVVLVLHDLVYLLQMHHTRLKLSGKTNYFTLHHNLLLLPGHSAVHLMCMIYDVVAVHPDSGWFYQYLAKSAKLALMVGGLFYNDCRLSKSCGSSCLQWDCEY